MSDHVYKKIELVGSSRTRVEYAIQNAMSSASKSLDHLDWFEVQEVRGDIQNGSVGYYQVSLKVAPRGDYIYYYSPPAGGVDYTIL